jgi:hypothetical protein
MTSGAEAPIVVDSGGTARSRALPGSASGPEWVIAQEGP